MSYSHTKFCWISSKDLRGDSITDDGWTDNWKDEGDYNIPFAFFFKKNMRINIFKSPSLNIFLNRCPNAIYNFMEMLIIMPSTNITKTVLLH